MASINLLSLVALAAQSSLSCGLTSRIHRPDLRVTGEEFKQVGNAMRYELKVISVFNQGYLNFVKSPELRNSIAFLVLFSGYSFFLYFKHFFR